MKVSIVMPLYNAASYVRAAIESVIAQTYSDWELIIVDDCSKDDSVAIVKQFFHDPRIRLLKNSKNSGAVVTRNNSIAEATGEIIAFLDSDDMWYPTKLEKQIGLYKKDPNTAIVFANYEQINQKGESLNKVIESPAVVNYSLLLKSNCIGCLTATYNRTLLGKRYFVQQGHEDYVLWLSILKEGYIAVNTQECLAKYRISANSLSSNKVKAAKWQWNIYRNVEKLNIFKSAYYFIFYAIAGLKKHK